MKKSTAALKAGQKTTIVCLIVGVVTTIVLRWRYPYNGFSDAELLSISRALGGTIAQIAVTLAGFILTSTAIFTAFSDKPLVQNMYKSGHASNLIAHMYIAIAFTIIACVSGVWALVTPVSDTLIIAILVGSAAACLTALIGVMRKLWFVLHFINGSRHDEYETVDHTAKEIPPSNA